MATDIFKYSIVFIVLVCMTLWQWRELLANCEISRILWTPKVHDRVHRSPPLVPFLSQIKPVRADLSKISFNPLNAELNPICHLLALLGSHHILHVSRIMVNLRLDLPRVVFLVPPQTPCIHFFSPLRATFYAYLILLDLIVPVAAREECTSWSP